MYLLLVKDFKIGTRNFPCCKMQIVLKDKTRLGDNFYFQRLDSQDLTSDVVYKFQSGLCNGYYYDECVRHLIGRNGEHIGTSILTKKQVKPEHSYLARHLLFCKHSASYSDFKILRTEREPANSAR